MNSIEEMSIVYLGQRLMQVFKLPSQPVECPTGDLLHLTQRLRAASGEAISYPIMGYSLTTIAPAEHVNAGSQMRMAMQTQGKGDTIGSLSALAVKFTFEVRYMDDDRMRLLRFMAKWMQADVRGLLNFRLRVEGAPVDVQVKPDNNLSVPAKETNTEASNMYEFTGTITMSTYMTGPFDEALLQVTRVTEVNTGFVVTPDAPADMSKMSIEEREQYIATQEDVDRHLAFVVTKRFP